MQGDECSFDFQFNKFGCLPDLQQRQVVRHGFTQSSQVLEAYTFYYDGLVKNVWPHKFPPSEGPLHLRVVYFRTYVYITVLVVTLLWKCLLHLPRDHPYFAREMAIMNVEWCDFVVFSNGEVVVDRILAD